MLFLAPLMCILLCFFSRTAVAWRRSAARDGVAARRGRGEAADGRAPGDPAKGGARHGEPAARRAAGAERAHARQHPQHAHAAAAHAATPNAAAAYAADANAAAAAHAARPPSHDAGTPSAHVEPRPGRRLCPPRRQLPPNADGPGRQAVDAQRQAAHSPRTLQQPILMQSVQLNSNQGTMQFYAFGVNDIQIIL